MAVDFFSLVVCATVAIVNRDVCTEIITHFFATINGKTRNSTKKNSSVLLMTYD